MKNLITSVIITTLLFPISFTCVAQTNQNIYSGVTLVQLLLADAGYLELDKDIDGIYGPITDAALQLYVIKRNYNTSNTILFHSRLHEDISNYIKSLINNVSDNSCKQRLTNSLEYYDLNPIISTPYWVRYSVYKDIKYEYNNSYPRVSENGSYYGEISKNTGRPKTVYVKGYYRKDGTYVRSHYRSKPKK